MEKIIRKGGMKKLYGGKDKEEWRTRRKEWIKKGRMENLNVGKDNEEWRSGIKERRMDNLN